MNKEIIMNMLSTLQHYKHDKTQLMQKYVQERLDQNLIQYYKKLQQSVDFLERKDSRKVIKKLNRVDKNDK